MTGGSVDAGWFGPARLSARNLVVPDSAEFEAIVAAQDTMAALRDLRQTVTAWQAVADKLGCGFECAWQLCAYRLRVERALGTRLAREVRRGGARTKGIACETAGVGRLPSGVSKQQAARFRQLALVPEHLFRLYLSVTKQRRSPPTAAGARRFGSDVPVGAATRPGQRGGASPTLSPGLLDIVHRVMSPDVCVGHPGSKARLHLRGDDRSALHKLSGDVFVACGPEADRWLPQLARLHRRGVVRQALAVVECRVGTDWFGAAIRSGWAFSFEREAEAPGHGGSALAHFGARRAAFAAASAVDGHACVDSA